MGSSYSYMKSSRRRPRARAHTSSSSSWQGSALWLVPMTGLLLLTARLVYVHLLTESQCEEASRVKSGSKKSGRVSAFAAKFEGTAKEKQSSVKKKKFKWKVGTASQQKLAALKRVQARGGEAVNADMQPPSDSRPAADSLSVSERMRMYKSDVESIEERTKARGDFHKSQRGVDVAKGAVSDERKEAIAAAFAKRAKSDVSSTDAWSRVRLAADRPLADASSEALVKAKSKTMNEVLMAAHMEDAVEIASALGLFAMESGPRIGGELDSDRPKRKRELLSSSESTTAVAKTEGRLVLNMNNSEALTKMTKAQRGKMQEILAHCIVDKTGVELVKMCNAAVDDHFVKLILAALASEKGRRSKVTELWLESNPIGDDGFRAIADFIRSDDKITVYKFQGMKRIISTPVCDELCDALRANHTVTKFVFEFRFAQHKDALTKVLRRNADEAREARLKLKAKAK